MPRMNTSLVKQEYLDYESKQVDFGALRVVVSVHRIEGRQGSWEKGFKFTTNTYGMLHGSKGYSVNHGASWHPDKKSAMKSKGKVKLESSKRGEFAFEAIQKINRDYDPSFKWKP